MKRIALFVVAGLLSLAASADQSKADGRHLLDEMIAANQHINYKGSFIYARGSDIQILKINHHIVDNRIQEKIWNINGELMEVIRNGDVQECWHIKGSKMPLSHTLPAGPYAYVFSHEMGESLENYQVFVDGNDRIAEHEALRLTITPKDQYRYGYRFWLERSSKLLLRSELVGQDGMPLDQFQYVDVAINPDFASNDFAPSIRDGFSHKEFIAKPVQSDRAFNSGMWTLKWLPDGYVLSNADSRSLESTKVDRLLYSDGMSSFTIYAELASAGMPEQQHHFGATVAATVKKGEYMLTLVGEIPMATAMMILDNIQAKG